MQDLVEIGAERAAGALEELLGGALRTPAPGRVDDGRGPFEPLAAVVCDVRGAVEGVIALVLPIPVRDSVVAALCPGEEPDGERAASALRELGNIVASQAVSAIADRLGARITLSVPTLLADTSGGVLARMLAERGDPDSSFAGVSELLGPEGMTGARLLVAGRTTGD